MLINKYNYLYKSPNYCLATSDELDVYKLHFNDHVRKDYSNRTNTRYFDKFYNNDNYITKKENYDYDIGSSPGSPKERIVNLCDTDEINLISESDECNSVDNLNDLSSLLIGKVKNSKRNKLVIRNITNNINNLNEEEEENMLGKPQSKRVKGFIKRVPDEKIFKEDMIMFKSSDIYVNPYKKENFEGKSLYNIDVTITRRCANCYSEGHRTMFCTVEGKVDTDTCYRCLEIYKENHKCSLVKCLRCNMIGHVASECQTGLYELPVCSACNNVGHNALDCLINPDPIKLEIKQSTQCRICGKIGHFICPFNRSGCEIDDYHSSDVEISDSDSDKTELACNIYLFILSLS